MSLKDTYTKAKLHSDENVVGKQSLTSYGNQFFDARLKFFNSICGSNIENIEDKRFIQSSVFKVRKDSNALGITISLTHHSKGEIQFACPRGDKEKLLMSVLPPSRMFDVQGKIYDYTGNIEAANERLVVWLAEVAPEHSAEIGAILDRIENPPRGPVMTIERAPA